MKGIAIVIPALLFLLLSLIISITSLAQHFVKMTDETRAEFTICACNHIPEKGAGEKTEQLRCEESINSLFQMKAQIL